MDTPINAIIHDARLAHLLHYKTRSTQKPGSAAKCMVWHKKAPFDTIMPGSTQKCPPQHASAHIAIFNPPPPLLWEIFFPIILKYFVFKNP